jgi:hypothetical protein
MGVLGLKGFLPSVFYCQKGCKIASDKLIDNNYMGIDN